MKSIDLNCDMGEMPETIADGTQEALLEFVSSVNVACGGHAGDEDTMRTTVEQALQRKVAIGAHPGYADRAHFGRVELQLSPEALAQSVFEQVSRLAEIAEKCDAKISHVKAHGALYNQAARDAAIAGAIANGVARWRRDVILVGLARSRMLDVFREAGFNIAAEAFADRRYEPDGSLRSRKFADALILDPAEAAAQALRIAENGSVVAAGGGEIRLEAQTICVHSDTPGAVKIAAVVAHRLRESGMALRATALNVRSAEVREA
jgi:5-oxoprolinase (ATP-hydrolysing) subunit A